jgi:hypothetical protein
MRAGLRAATGRTLVERVLLLCIRLYLERILDQMDRLMALAAEGKLKREAAPELRASAARAAADEALAAGPAHITGCASAHQVREPAAGCRAETHPTIGLLGPTAEAPDAEAPDAELAVAAVGAALSGAQTNPSSTDPAASARQGAPARRNVLADPIPAEPGNVIAMAAAFRPRLSQIRHAPLRGLLSKISSSEARLRASKSFRY